MRRILFVLFVAGLGAVVPVLSAGADPSTPRTTFQKTPVEVAEPGDRAATPAVPDDTNVVGVQWDGDASARFEIETRREDGRWRAGGTVMAPDGGADPDSEEARGAAARIGARFASEPLQVNDPDQVRVRVTEGDVRDVRIVAVGSPPGFAKPATPPSPLTANPVATGGLALAAAGIATSRRGRKSALVGVLVIATVGTAALIGVPNAGAVPGDVPFPPNPGYVSRAQWGADESLRIQACPDGPDFAEPRLIVIHHTASTNSYSPAQTAATVRGIYTYYIQGRGYCDHGYNFLVDRYGIIYEGRYGGVDRGVIGAHATLFNTGTVGIAMIGDHTSSPVTGATFSALSNLLAWKMSVHQINPYFPVAYRGAVVPPIIGHRDAGRISGDGTSCPGNAGGAILGSLLERVKPRVAYGYPLGNLEIARRRPTAINVRGWTADPDVPNQAIQVHVYVDGRGVAIGSAGNRRRDVARLYPHLGENHGFNITTRVTQAPHFVCVFAISVGNGGNRQLGCRWLDGNTVGSLDSGSRRPGAIVVRGWAIDPDTTASVPIHAYVDGVGAAIGTADRPRPDVAKALPGYGENHGYEMLVPVTGDRTVCTFGISTRGKVNPRLGCVRTSGVPRGSLDGVTRPGGQVRVRGWTFDNDSAGPIQVHVYVDGVGRAVGTANTSRPDVGARFPGFGDNHGFDITFGGVGPGQHRVCVYGISVVASGNALIGCHTVT
jgi:hypothetical protein